MGAMISARDCETRLGVQRLKTGKLRLLQVYVDAYYEEDLIQRRSTTGYVFTIAE